MSLKPAMLLVVEDCHLYCRVPVWPLAAVVLEKAAGLKGFMPVCAAAIVPPEVGFTVIVHGTTLTAADSVPKPTILTARSLML